jgi:hypothetical protein
MSMVRNPLLELAVFGATSVWKDAAPSSGIADASPRLTPKATFTSPSRTIKVEPIRAPRKLPKPARRRPPCPDKAREKTRA